MDFTIAKIGRSVGLDGWVKLHLMTDFPEQFTEGAGFISDIGPLTLEGYDPERGEAKFQGYDSKEASGALTNLLLSTTEEATRKQCRLEAGEYFWFDLEGLDVYEADTCLGKVKEIQRMGGTDYFLIQTDPKWTGEGMAGTFLLPYLDRYVRHIDLAAKRIDTQGAMDILEAS